MTDIIEGSGLQHLLTGMIMAGALWGWLVTPSMIPLFTRSLTRHSRNKPGVKDYPKQHAS